MKLNEVASNSCRVCLKRTPKLRSLYNPLDEGDEPPNEMLRLIAGVELEAVDAYETLPKFICKNCELSLNLAFQFRAKVLRTHQIIETYRKQHWTTHTAIAKACNSIPDIVKEELDDWAGGDQSNEESCTSEDHLTNNRDMKVEALELSFSDIEEIDMQDEELMVKISEDEEINAECKPEYLDEIEDYDDEDQSTETEHKDHLFSYDAADVASDGDSVIEVTIKEESNSPSNNESDKSVRNKNSTAYKTLSDNVEKARKSGNLRIPMKKSNNNKQKQKPQLINHETEADTSTRKLNGNASHICDVCGNIYSKRGRMMEHRRRHDKELRFACELCDKRFHLREKLRKHMFLHTGGKPYKCSFCSRTFFYESVKKAHEAVHSGAKPYVCDECNKAFAYAHALSKHKLIHADIKLYHCEYCGKDFRLQHHMKQHIETKLHQNAVRVAQMSLTEGKSPTELLTSTSNT